MGLRRCAKGVQRGTGRCPRERVKAPARVVPQKEGQEHADD
jgi:hypothetical protein